MSIVLPEVEAVDNRLFVPEWERRERERLDAARCPNPGCRALPPNHRTGCPNQRLPDPEAERCLCGCGYVPGSLGWRLGHGSGS